MTSEAMLGATWQREQQLPTLGVEGGTSWGVSFRRHLQNDCARLSGLGPSSGQQCPRDRDIRSISIV